MKSWRACFVNAATRNIVYLLVSPDKQQHCACLAAILVRAAFCQWCSANQSQLSSVMLYLCLVDDIVGHEFLACFVDHRVPEVFDKELMCDYKIGLSLRGLFLDGSFVLESIVSR